MDDQLDIKLLKITNILQTHEEFANTTQSEQYKINKNIVKRLEELEDYQAQTIKKLEKLEGQNKEQIIVDNNLIKRIEEIEDFTQTAALEANARLDIGIENRTIAFRKIKALEDFNAQTIKFNSNT